MEIRRVSLILIVVAVLVIALAGWRVMAASSATLPAAGMAAPSFSLTSQEGKKIGLSDLKGKWVILYFYPKDFTSGCTIEAHNFQRDLDKYAARDATIVGVSVDTAESHKDFCAKESLNFKLLADTDKTVSKAYGSLLPIGLSARNTFIVDPNGMIAKVFEGVKPPQHSEEVLAALDELQKKNQK
ncbi:MAG TPA: peroxiredoxin [Patescibacteria group bacterium]|nr:peroxiredoxin [Patescibacteria group bacterium]